MAGSWLDTRGDPQPETTTWRRWRKRQDQKFRAYWEANEHKYTPSELRANSNYRLEKRAKEIGHINRVHKRWMAKGAFNGRKWPAMAMPHTIRHLSRSEINRVRVNVKASTGRSSG